VCTKLAQPLQALDTYPAPTPERIAQSPPLCLQAVKQLDSLHSLDTWSFNRVGLGSGVDLRLNGANGES